MTGSLILTPTDGAVGDNFGYSVAFAADGLTAIVGGYGDDVGGNTDQGSARVFVWDTGTSSWIQKGGPLTPTDGAGSDYFGYSVSLSADGLTAIVGGYGDDLGSNANQGSARVFVWDTGTSSWIQRGGPLTPTDGAASDYFGRSVALSSDGLTAIVGGSSDDVGSNGDQGSARVFSWDGTNWVEGTPVAALCYLKGTRVLTPRGEIPIEDLTAGDLVATRLGGFQPIRWIGEQRFPSHVTPMDGRPILIKAGALGANIPHRDLRVSPGHSMLVNGVLVYAKLLVNGVTILRDDTPGELHYYQLDLGGHDCILAEGAWSESYADFPGGRRMFHNAADFFEKFPDYVEPTEVSLCLPRPEAGLELDQAIRSVVSHATAQIEPGSLRGAVDRIRQNKDGTWRVTGWAMDKQHPSLPQLLEITLDGAVIGTVLACQYRWDLDRARLGPCAFMATLPSWLNIDDAQRLIVQRAIHGDVLPKTQECRDTIQALAANSDSSSTPKSAVKA